MIRRIPAFQQAAVCLTKFGPESGETAEEILARKDLERRSGVGAHKNEFWWGVGEKGTAQSIQTLISQHGGNTVGTLEAKTSGRRGSGKLGNPRLDEGKSAPGFRGRPPPVVVVGIASSARADGHERVKTTLASGPSRTPWFRSHSARRQRARS